MWLPRRRSSKSWRITSHSRNNHGKMSRGRGSWEVLDTIAMSPHRLGSAWPRVARNDSLSVGCLTRGRTSSWSSRHASFVFDRRLRCALHVTPHSLPCPPSPPTRFGAVVPDKWICRNSARHLDARPVAHCSESGNRASSRREEIGRKRERK
jgi:hypothetical protein